MTTHIDKSSDHQIKYEGVTQNHMVSCGAAAAKQIVDIIKPENTTHQKDFEKQTWLYGEGKKIAKILESIGLYDKVAKKYRSKLGTSLPAMQNSINYYLKDKKVEVEIKEGASIDDLKENIDKGLPVACLFLGQGGANPFDMRKEEHKGTYGRHYVVAVGYTMGTRTIKTKDESGIKEKQIPRIKDITVRNPLGFEEQIPRQEFYKRRNLNIKYLSLHNPEGGIKTFLKQNIFPQHQRRRDYVIKKHKIPTEKQKNALIENLILREFMKPRSAIFVKKLSEEV